MRAYAGPAGVSFKRPNQRPRRLRGAPLDARLGVCSLLGLPDLLPSRREPSLERLTHKLGGNVWPRAGRSGEERVDRPSTCALTYTAGARPRRGRGLRGAIKAPCCARGRLSAAGQA